jgi:hypothetical protein
MTEADTLITRYASIKSSLRQLWAKRWLQKCTAATVFCTLALIHYQLAHLLVSLNVASCEKCTPLKTLPHQMLLISDIAGSKSDPMHPVFTGAHKHIVNIHFNKARLDDKLIANLQRFQSDVPVTSQPVDVNTANAKNNKILIKIYLRNLSIPQNKLYFARELSPDNTQPDFKMKTEGLEPAIEISQMNIDENNSMTIANELKIGDWRYKLAGIPITLLPEDGTDIIFRFLSTDWGAEQVFEPFFFTDTENSENGAAISALAAGVTDMTDGEQVFNSLLCGAPASGTVLLTRTTNLSQKGCPNPKKLEPLNLSAFRVGKDYVQISATGNAWVQINGEPITIDLIALIKDNPYLAVLLASFDALMLAWIKRVFG